MTIVTMHHGVHRMCEMRIDFIFGLTNMIGISVKPTLDGNEKHGTKCVNLEQYAMCHNGCNTC
jgi:hypothetical protein